MELDGEQQLASNHLSELVDAPASDMRDDALDGPVIDLRTDDALDGPVIDLRTDESDAARPSGQATPLARPRRRHSRLRRKVRRTLQTYKPSELYRDIKRNNRQRREYRRYANYR